MTKQNLRKLTRREEDAVIDLAFTEFALAVGRKILSLFPMIPKDSKASREAIARFAAEIHNGMYRRDPEAAMHLYNDFDDALKITAEKLKANYEAELKRPGNSFVPHYTYQFQVIKFAAHIRELALPHLDCIKEQAP